MNLAFASLSAFQSSNKSELTAKNKSWCRWTGSKWQERRKILTPAFHFKILEDFVHVFNEHSQVLVSRLNEQATSGQHFNIYPFITRCTLDIICGNAIVRALLFFVGDKSDFVVQRAPWARKLTPKTKVIRITSRLFTRKTIGKLNYWWHKTIGEKFDCNLVDRMSRLVQKRTVTLWLFVDWVFNLSTYGREQRRCLNILHSFTDQVSFYHLSLWMKFHLKVNCLNGAGHSREEVGESST